MKRVLPLIGIMLMASCSQYHANPIVVQSEIKNSIKKNIVGKSVNRVEPTLSEWRNFFTDTALVAIIESALVENRDIRIAIENVSLSKATYQLKQGSKAPIFGVNANGAFTQNAKNLSGTNKFTERYNASLGLSNYELDFFSKIKNLNDEALAQYFKSVEAARTVKLTVITETAKIYYSYQQAKIKLNYSKSMLKSAEAAKDLLNLRVNAGLTPKNTVRQTEVSIAQLQAQKSGSERELNAFYSAMIQIAGKDVERYLVKGSFSKNPNFKLSTPKNLASTVLLNRPDVMAKEFNLYAADANINSARLAFFPSVKLTSSMGFGSTELKTLFSLDSFIWQFVPSVTIPLFNEPTNVANLNIAKARKNIAIADYEKTIQQAFSEVYLLVTQYKSLLDTLKAMEKGVYAQEKTVTSETQKYKAGLTNYIDVLGAKQKLYSAKMNVINAQSDLVGNRIELYKALGGGDDLDEASRQKFFDLLRVKGDKRFKESS